MSDIDDLPLESRTGSTSLFGKLTAELPKQRISLDTYTVLQRKAAEADLTLAEYVRTVLDVQAHGFEHVANLSAQRLRQVVGTGGDRG